MIGSNSMVFSRLARKAPYCGLRANLFGRYVEPPAFSCCPLSAVLLINLKPPINLKHPRPHTLQILFFSRSLSSASGGGDHSGFEGN
jgi:hypothetical protein